MASGFTELDEGQLKILDFKEREICIPIQHPGGYNLLELSKKWDWVFSQDSWSGPVHVFAENVTEETTETPKKISEVSLHLVSLKPITDEALVKVLEKQGYRLPTLPEILIGLENGLSQNGDYFIQGGRKVSLSNNPANSRDPAISMMSIKQEKIITHEKPGEGEFTLTVVPSPKS